jgi:uncharacterized protein YdeI (YjbR/CyaY-like superfamily)
MPSRDVPHVYIPSRPALRAWLTAHHADHGPIWLVYDKLAAGNPIALVYDAIVEESLCFGWIDSVPGKVSATRTKLYLAPRKPRSVWSALNKRRVESLTTQGLIHPAGQTKIDAARADGSWSALDAAESLQVPPDLARALKDNPAAKTHFTAFPPGVRKNILTWITLAKRPETRAARISRTVELAAKNQRAVGKAASPTRPPTPPRARP